MHRLTFLLILILSCNQSQQSKIKETSIENPLPLSKNDSSASPFEIAFMQIDEPYKIDTFSTETYRFITGEGFGYGRYTVHTISETDLLLKIKEFALDTISVEHPELTKASIRYKSVQKISESEWQDLKVLLKESYFYSMNPISNFEIEVILDGHNWELEGVNYFNERQLAEFGVDHNYHKITRQAPYKGKLGEVAKFFLARNPNK